MSTGLIVISVTMLLSCTDPVSNDSGPGTAPEITAISAEKSNFAFQSNNSSESITENTIVTISVKDAENDVRSILVTGEGIRDGGELYTGDGWRKAGSATDYQIPVMVFVGWEGTYTISFIAIDSKGNESDTAKITLTVSK